MIQKTAILITSTDDKNLNIKWPSNKPIISVEDKNAINFVDFKKKYL